MNITDIAREQLRAAEEGRRYALVTIVEAIGTTSRSEGKMLVYADGRTVGTVGGGNMEARAREDALEALRLGENRLVSYENSAAADSMLRMYIELSPTLPLVLVVGGGHVGYGVLRLCKFLGWETWLADDRGEEVIGRCLPYADRFIPLRDYEADLRTLNLPAEAQVVLCSYSHCTDEAALAAMTEKQLAYLGMLGSKRKVSSIIEHLRQRGIAEEALARAHTPIGLALGGETPEEVALSIVAQMQALRTGSTPQPLK